MSGAAVRWPLYIQQSMNRILLIISLLLLISSFVSMIMAMSPVLTILLLVLSAGGFIYCLRGSYYLSKASGIIRTGKREEY